MDFTDLKENANVWFFSTDNFEINYDWKHTFHEKNDGDMFNESYYIRTAFFHFHIQFQYSSSDKEYLFFLFAMQSDIPKTKEDWQLELPPISLPSDKLTKPFTETYSTLLRRQNIFSKNAGSYHYKTVNSIEELMHLVSFWKQTIRMDYTSIFEEEKIFMEEVRQSTNEKG